MKPEATIAYSLRVRGIPLRWLTEIERWNPPHEFIDIQAKGSYTLWRHRHRFSNVGGGTLIADTVDYLGEIFDYRAQQVRGRLPRQTGGFVP